MWGSLPLNILEVWDYPWITLEHNKVSKLNTSVLCSNILLLFEEGDMDEGEGITEGIISDASSFFWGGGGRAAFAVRALLDFLTHTFWLSAEAFVGPVAPLAVFVVWSSTSAVGATTLAFSIWRDQGVCLWVRERSMAAPACFLQVDMSPIFSKARLEWALPCAPLWSLCIWGSSDEAWILTLGQCYFQPTLQTHLRINQGCLNMLSAHTCYTHWMRVQLFVFLMTWGTGVIQPLWFLYPIFISLLVGLAATDIAEYSFLSHCTRGTAER